MFHSLRCFITKLFSLKRLSNSQKDPPSVILTDSNDSVNTRRRNIPDTVVNAEDFPFVEDDTDKQSEFIIDLRTIQVLRCQSRYPGEDREVPRRSSLQNVLDWIAQCFVRTNDGARFAAALSVRPGMLTIHIASDRAPTAEDHLMGKRFIAEVVEAVSRKDRLDDPDVFYGIIMQFVRMYAQTAWERLVRKIDLILDVNSWNGVGEPDETLQRIDGLVDDWVDRWTTMTYGGESSTPIQKVADKSFGGDTHKALKHVFRCLFDRAQRIRTENFDTDEERINYLREVIFRCEVLHSSDFLRDLDQSPVWMKQLSNCPPGKNLLLCLRRRIARLERYFGGATDFIFRGTRYFDLILQPGVPPKPEDLENCAQIVWVGEVIPRVPANPYTWPSSPEDWFSGVLHRSGVRLSRERKRRAFSCLRIHDAWQYDQQRIAVVKYTIGVSKDVCWACELYLAQLRARLGDDFPGWKVPQTYDAYRKAAHDWMVPVALPEARTLTRDVVERTVNNVFQITKREMQDWAKRAFKEFRPISPFPLF
ncbi:hypothetical protein BKA93DRAFT_116912 [Sparassis latifolia]